MKPLIEVQNITKKYKDLFVLDCISFSVYENEIVSIIGPSGCGKTTLLRLIGGFEKSDKGSIKIDDAVVTKPSKEAIMVFQSLHQLLPWKTALRNISDTLVMTGIEKSKKIANEIALKYLQDVDLINFANTYPTKLSGGMNQRVAIARGLSLRPKVLLMDEPFSALDSFTRKNLQDLVVNICKKYAITVVFVTHSIREAVNISDRIIVLSKRPGAIRKIYEIGNNKKKMENDIEKYFLEGEKNESL